MLFTDNFIVKNWAHVGSGGGLYYTNTLTATLFHNTIANNTNADSQTAPTAFGKGNALFVDGTGPLVIGNSIIRGPRLPATSDSLAIRFGSSTPQPDVYHSCTGPVFVGAQWFEDGAIAVDPNGYVYPPVPGATVTHAFPLFVNPAVDDFHLDAASPCIDAGDSTVPGITPTDFDGDPRPTPTTIVDMGADERP